MADAAAPVRKSTRASSGGLARQLAATFAESLLPDEREAVSPERIAEAARFALDVLTTRQPGSPAVAIESVGGRTGERFMRLAIVNDDMPFLVDSIAALVADHGLGIEWLAHPVLSVERGATGKLKSLAGTRRESVIYFETPRVDARQRRDLAAALATVLGDVYAAVADWPKMQAASETDAAAIATSDAEGAALLRWLGGGMLTQLGHVTRRRDGSQSGLLGICRKSARTLLAEASYERAFAWFDKAIGKGKRSVPVPLIVKANRIANVHRRVPLDLFIVPVLEDGPRGTQTVAALSVHAGVWTSAALAAAPDRIPRLREGLERLMTKFEFDPSGHAGKALVHALTALPHDLLIGFSAPELERIATTMMSLVDRPRPKLALVRAPLARHLFAFVWLPRDAMSTTLRRQVQDLLSARTRADVLDWSLSIEGSSLALMRFVLDIRETRTHADEDVLDAELQTMVRGWSAAVEAELAQGDDASRAAAIAARYAEAFPPAYRTAYGAAEAARDIRQIRALQTLADAPSTQRAARLHHREDGDPAGPCGLRLKLYQREGSLALSDAVPVLENFGFRVLEELPTALDEGRLAFIHDFLLAVPPGTEPEALLARSGEIEAALAAVLNGVAEDDPFNRLIVATGLAAREADWLRAWFRYLRQAGAGYGIATVVDALRHAPQATRALLAIFVACHDPDFTGDRDGAAKAASDRFREALGKVAAINDDRLLRLYRSLVDAILRTNAFAPAAQEALAFKLDSSRVPGLPKPLPWREIFVYSRRVEGIHLRAGPIARGGLRWSDRRDDFRTEVLGLMKAQRVKNAVIVPTGAKGGFYPKQLPDLVTNRDGWLAEGKASYQAFIRTLLSITDNIVGSKVVHPPRVVVHDGEDPYFVVAADKGTATFSDVANAIAEDADFWLDDAFASGGSNGYDHKAMGITAKGAWVSVQRHFLEMGVDVQRDPVTVSGVGDMSGDVFGNGMLLSKTIRLVAAFDHRHVFLDPDPDPARSWKERARMFALPRSSWADYDAGLISKGGGVFARSLKSIPLSKQVRAVLGVDATALEPEALITAILKSPVDLFWFGGIGTYVKASTEAAAQVGDPANDSLRIDATELRAKIVGEGANLGMTQAARIEFALVGDEGRGGRINTDFIDNSAGVNCSDNEVNIKIALAAATRTGNLSEAKRNALLESMTDEVGELVLENNRLQALALSIAKAGGAPAVAAQLHMIEALEERGALDRKTEGLATGEVFARRAVEGLGLTRPELAVLLSSTKLVLQDEIENSALPDDPALTDLLVSYFPSAMRETYRRQIEGHQLRRAIVATSLANLIINRMGIVHPFELSEEEGAGLADICSAFVAAERLFNAGALWAELESAKMPEDARIYLFRHAAGALRSHIADLIRAGAHAASPSQIITALDKRVQQLSAATGELLTSASREQSSKLIAEFVAMGAPERLGAKVAHLYDLDGSIGLASLSTDAEIDARALTAAFTDLGQRLGLDWAQSTAAMLNPSDVWERLLVAGLSRDFQQMRLDFLRRLSRRKGAKENPSGAVANWSEEHAAAIRQFRGMIGRAQSSTPVAPAILAQIASQARNLLGR